MVRDMIARTRTDIVHGWFVCSFGVEDQDAQLLLRVPFRDTVSDEGVWE